MKKLNWEKLALEFETTDITLTKMSKREGVDRRTLSKHFKELGVIIINKQNDPKFDEHVFDVIDTEEKAYWLGFIFADGSIRSKDKLKKSAYSLEISLNLSDKEHLNKLSKFFKHQNPNIVKVSNTNFKNCQRCRFIVSSKHLWNTLNDFGCTPNKSLTLKFPNKSIFKDSSLIRHFIRGYFDGDGCFSRYVHKTIVSPIISIIGTPEFLTSLQEHINIRSYLYQDKRHTDRTKYLIFHKEEGIQLINYLYNNSSIYLNRKFKLYSFFKNGSRSIQEWIELQLGNIGESPEMDDAEINLEIKESESSYSVEGETL